jgi:hypothetical protein
MSTEHVSAPKRAENALGIITLTEQQFDECLVRAARQVTSGNGKLWLGGASRPDGSGMLLMIDGAAQFQTIVDDAPRGVGDLWGNEINHERASAILNSPYFSNAARTTQ